MPQCYNTESYNDKRKSLIFHHVKTLTLFGDVLPFGPQVMVGCQSTRRLFILDSGLGLNSTIYRINPDSGEVEMAWLVDGESRALTVAGKNHLLLTTHDRLKLYDTDGKFIRDVPTPALPMEEEMHESLLLPDGMYHRSTFPRSQFVANFYRPQNVPHAWQALTNITRSCG